MRSDISCLNYDGRQLHTSSSDEADGHFDLQARPMPLTITRAGGVRKCAIAAFERIRSSARNAAEFSRIRLLLSRAIRQLARSNLKKAGPPPSSAFFLSALEWRIGYSIRRTVFPPRYSKSKLAFNGTPRGDVVPDYSASLTSSISDRAVSNSNDNRRLSG